MPRPTQPPARLLGRDGAFLLAALAVFGVAFAVASGTGRDAVEAGTFAFAAVAAFAALAASLAVRARHRRDEQISGQFRELAELQRRTLIAEGNGRPEPKVLLLHDGAGVERARIERRRPRPLDVEEAVAHEQTLALRTLPSVKAPPAGSLRIYREPSEQDRNGFREKVERYGASLREALERYDAYRRERALLVSGRFRFENRGRRPAHDVVVRAYFPDEFEIVREAAERPALPKRPTFHVSRAGLTALLGGDPRPAARPGTSSASPEPALPRTAGNVSRPGYRKRPPTVEVTVDALGCSSPADMPGDGAWVLRLARPGEYRIRWEVSGEGLEEPARGELWLEVADLFDDTPIRSVKELLAEDQLPAVGSTLEPGIEAVYDASDRRPAIQLGPEEVPCSPG